MPTTPSLRVLQEIASLGRPKGHDRMASALAAACVRQGYATRSGVMWSHHDSSKQVAAYVLTPKGEQLLRGAAEEPVSA